MKNNNFISFEEILRIMVRDNMYFTSIGNLHIWREKSINKKNLVFKVMLVDDSDE